MLFNAGKAYVKQIDRGHQYSELCPVYGLSLVNDIFLTDEKYKTNFYHHYRLAHHEIPSEEIKGIELIFIELPKFAAQNFTQKKIRNLWLRFLTEIDENTKEVSPDLISESEIKTALECLQVSAFDKKELAYYEKYWDKIRVERAAIQDAVDKIVLKLAEAEQREENERVEREKIFLKLEKAVQAMNARGFSFDEIANDLDISIEEIKQLISRYID
jgi:predicted transposase/invertase (TIGR01784 family)